MTKKAAAAIAIAIANQYETELEMWQSLSAQAKLNNTELYICCDSFAFSGYVTDVLFGKYLVLTGAKWVFSTGDFAEKAWADAQKVPDGTWHVALSKIESFGTLK